MSMILSKPGSPRVESKTSDPRSILMDWGYSPEEANKMVSWQARRYEDAKKLLAQQQKMQAISPFLQAGGQLAGSGVSHLVKALLGSPSVDGLDVGTSDGIGPWSNGLDYGNALTGNIGPVADGMDYGAMLTDPASSGIDTAATTAATDPGFFDGISNFFSNLWL